MKDIFFQAIACATDAWESAINPFHWQQGLAAAVYFATAFLCWVQHRKAKVAGKPSGAWYFSVFVLCLLGANAVLLADLWLTECVRSMAKLQGWYSVRRIWQYALVFAIMVLAWLCTKPLRNLFAASQVPAGTVPLGLTTLLLLFALRLVSAHDTDTLLNTRLYALSVGRLLELLGIAWVLYDVAMAREIACAKTNA